MKTELERIAKLTLEKKDGKLYYGGYLYLEGTQITDTSNVNRNAPELYTWREGKYIKADGVFSQVICQKGNVYKIRQIGKSKEYFLVTDGHEVFISEYDAPKEFVCIWQKEVTNSMNTTKTYRPIEKLFVHESVSHRYKPKSMQKEILFNFN